MKRTTVALVGVVLVAAVAVGLSSFVLSSPAERSARQDVEALSTAVSDYVAETGRLPRITVAPGVSDGGDSIWGPEFLVESQAIRRADPSKAVTFFVVGVGGGWCVEVQYAPPSLFSDSGGQWVSAHGQGEDVGRTVNGRCGADYVLELSPAPETGPAAPGTVVAAAGAPIGTCFEGPFSAESAARPSAIPVVACDSVHFGEVFLMRSGTESAFGPYEKAAAETCATALMTFVGVPRNISALTAEPFTVDEAAWDSGNRAFSCFLYLSTQDYPLVGSAKDSRR